MSPDPALVIATYTRAADTMDGLPFWHHYGRLTVERAGVRTGERVIDLCCGTGASALPAARAVGPTGSVLGVDLTPALLDVARANAARQGLTQARFEAGDVTALAFPRGSFDVVQSVFGLFFLPDMPETLRRAWDWLAPGGRLVTTVWGEVVLAPGEAWFWDAVRREDPSLDHISPAAELATRTIETLSFGLIGPEVSITILAVWECLIGLGLLIGRYMRVTLLLLFVQMIGTVSPVFLFPAEVFTRIPYAPTLEGQYIIKNLVLVSAALVLGATVRGGGMVVEPGEPIAQPGAALPAAETGSR